MLEGLAGLFGAGLYAAHAVCLTGDPLMIALFILTHVVTTASYGLIGGVLVLDQAAAIRAMVRHRLAFGTFIGLCGLSHATEALTFYSAVYRLEALVMAATASVSAMTAGLVLQEVRRGR
jgi:hypothetical protein